MNKSNPFFTLVLLIFISCQFTSCQTPLEPTEMDQSEEPTLTKKEIPIEIIEDYHFIGINNCMDDLYFNEQVLEYLSKSKIIILNKIHCSQLTDGSSTTPQQYINNMNLWIRSLKKFNPQITVLNYLNVRIHYAENLPHRYMIRKDLSLNPLSDTWMKILDNNDINNNGITQELVDLRMLNDPNGYATWYNYLSWRSLQMIGNNISAYTDKNIFPDIDGIFLDDARGLPSPLKVGAKNPYVQAYIDMGTYYGDREVENLTGAELEEYGKSKVNEAESKYFSSLENIIGIIKGKGQKIFYNGIPYSERSDLVDRTTKPLMFVKNPMMGALDERGFNITDFPDKHPTITTPERLSSTLYWTKQMQKNNQLYFVKMNIKFQTEDIKTAENYPLNPTEAEKDEYRNEAFQTGVSEYLMYYTPGTTMLKIAIELDYKIKHPSTGVLLNKSRLGFYGPWTELDSRVLRRGDTEQILEMRKQAIKNRTHFIQEINLGNPLGDYYTSKNNPDLIIREFENGFVYLNLGSEVSLPIESDLNVEEIKLIYGSSISAPYGFDPHISIKSKYSKNDVLIIPSKSSAILRNN